MPRQYISPSDIEIPFESGTVKIFGAMSSYLATISVREVIIRYGKEIVWDSKRVGDEDGVYSGWADDAKEAIAQHSNAKIPKSE